MREIYRHACDVRYPLLSLQSGAQNIGWGQPVGCSAANRRAACSAATWCRRRSTPATAARQAQVQMSVALDPLDAENAYCEAAARRGYEAALPPGPGITFTELVRAMEAPIRGAGCWAKPPWPTP